MGFERIDDMETLGQISDAQPITSGAVSRLFTLAQWHALARRTGFNVQGLASLPEISLSVRSLERLFESNFGAPPSHYLTRWWAEAARDYIVATGTSNKQTASQFGFWDEAHLCHVFKQMFNRTPQSFSPRNKFARAATNAV